MSKAKLIFTVTSHFLFFPGIYFYKPLKDHSNYYLSHEVAAKAKKFLFSKKN